VGSDCRHAEYDYIKDLSVIVTKPVEGEIMKRIVVSADCKRKLEITAVLEGGQLHITPDVQLLDSFKYGESIL
jgi:hypothetical protein